MKHSNEVTAYVNNPEYIDALLGDFSSLQCELDHLKQAYRNLFEAGEMMWNTACTNHTSTPSKAAFLKLHAALQVNP